MNAYRTNTSGRLGALLSSAEADALIGRPNAADGYDRRVSSYWADGQYLGGVRTQPVTRYTATTRPPTTTRTATRTPTAY